MKLRLIISAIPMIALLGCGSDSGTFSISTGTYNLTNIAATPPDNCNIAAVFQGNPTMQITVASGAATFIVGGVVDPLRNPVSQIQGNNLTQGTRTFDFDNRPTYDCTETITEGVSGNLVANDQAQLTLTYSSARVSGTQCTAQNLGYKTFPCSSSMTLLAKKR